MSRRLILPLAGCCALAAAGYATTPATAGEAPGYRYVVVADSVEDGLDPFSFGCASINADGDIAFRAGRPLPDGFNTADGIYRADRGQPGLVTIAENERRFTNIGNNPSLNDLGQVSFAAGLERDGEAIFRGDGQRLTVIARTEPGRFNFFGFDTSVNDAGRVAFKAELDEDDGFDEGMFSGTGDRITTHYRASTSRFDGSDSRPSINDPGAIAFGESVDFEEGIFVTRGAGFRTVSPPDDEVGLGEPQLNDNGTVAFERSFSDPTGEFVTQIVTGRQEPFAVVADSRAPASSFGFRPPAINNLGQVAYQATLDDGSSGAFVGQAATPVVRTGDVVDGDPVSNVVLCEEGLNDASRLALVLTLDDAAAPEGVRVAVVRAVPR